MVRVLIVAGVVVVLAAGVFRVRMNCSRAVVRMVIGQGAGTGTFVLRDRVAISIESTASVVSAIAEGGISAVVAKVTAGVGIPAAEISPAEIAAA